MLKQTLVTLGAMAFVLITPAAAFANSPHSISDNFNNKFHEDWFFTNFEDLNGVFSRNPGVQCGVDACASIKKQNPDKFLEIAVRPTTTVGVYTNTDVSEVELGLPTSLDSGHWNPEVGHPVVLESRVRWNSAYNLDGSGNAVGTSGVILWNSAVGATGPEPQYASIGFHWAKNDVLGGFLAGLTATTTTNLAPISVFRPASTLNIHDWVNLKTVWSVNGSGQQSVEYFVNNSSIGSFVLPVALHNMSVEMWDDNQEPVFGPTGFITTYPAPSVEQAIDIDSVSVNQ